jgi:hypothetical protein
MSHPDLDRYYTPAEVARAVVERSEASRGSRCVDTACGDGSLLRAAHEIVGRARCFGMDVDRGAIRRLRSSYPSWTLSHADSLLERSWSRVVAGRESVGAELALLNPPFSMAAKKGVVIEVGSFSGRCSVAMAHVLSALVRGRPATCCAIVPESLMFSDLDRAARAYISGWYRLVSTRGLRNSTFRGARANAVILTLVRHEFPEALDNERTDLASLPSTVDIVRGGLPVFEAEFAPDGRPFIHSTDIGPLVLGRALARLRRVRPIARGRAEGYAILLPRVGLPLREALEVTHLATQVQLSDCVVALVFSSKGQALRWRNRMASRWSSLRAQYHGTGARYVTVERLRGWLAAVPA